jgi:hypothetical protein
MTDASIRYWGGANADLITRIYNAGTASSFDTTLDYQMSQDGQIIASDYIPGLAAGGAYTTVTYLDLSTLTAGRYTLNVVVNEPSTPETNLDNNVRSLSLQILPDLAVPATYLRATPLTDDTIVMSATIFNTGVATSQPVNVAFYRSEGVREPGRLFSTTIGAILPTAGLTVSTQVAGPLCLIHVVVDQEQRQDELARANNRASLRRPQPLCADFVHEVQAGQVQQAGLGLLAANTVQFYDMSAGEITGWLWDFGDGATSNEQDPLHVYTAPGSYTVTLTVSGPAGVDTNARPSLIEVAPDPNLAPVAIDDMVTTTEGIPVVIAVLTNDSDPDGDTLTISAVATPQHGAVVIDGNSLRYTPTVGYVGNDTFTYTVIDGQGGSAMTTVTVVITPDDGGGSGDSNIFLPLVSR